MVVVMVGGRAIKYRQGRLRQHLELSDFSVI